MESVYPARKKERREIGEIHEWRNDGTKEGRKEVYTIQGINISTLINQSEYKVLESLSSGKV